MLHAAEDRFFHGCIIVRMGECFHTEGAVLTLFRLSVAENNHTRRDVFTAEVGNIICLDALRHDLQRKH